MKATITLMLSLLLLAACSDENSEIRGQFLSGCIQGGASKSICTCTFDKLEEKYSSAELEAMNTPYKAPPERLIKDAIRFAQACQADLTYNPKSGSLASMPGTPTMVVQTLPGTQTSDNSCVDAWVAEHRKEVGEEALIHWAMLEEWEGWCKAGKAP